jgi:hypothetical protein
MKGYLDERIQIPMVFFRSTVENLVVVRKIRLQSSPCEEAKNNLD